MTNKNYELRILPLFEDDLNHITDYFVHRLKNIDAAECLVDDVESAIYERLSAPESFETFHSTHDHTHPYYRIKVRNFFIFYVVIGNVMEVRRILYKRRNWTRFL